MADNWTTGPSTGNRGQVPQEYLSEVSIPGIENARLPMTNIDSLEQLEREELSARLREKATKLAEGAALYPHFLAISGGGAEGFFAAGLLTGWSESGTRPTFQVVSGVSTGALIAPVAFLGQDYDHVLQTLYTTTDTRNILQNGPG